MSNQETLTEPLSQNTNIEASLGKTIREIGIPPCPAILNQINIEIQKDEPDFGVISEAVGSDVGVSAGLIALANSPYFGSRMQARSAHDALMKLGLKKTSHAVAGIILRDLFPSNPSMERFWHSSAGMARISGWLAQAYPSSLKLSPGDAYTFGLFRDCGIPLMMMQAARYSETLAQANAESSKSFTDIEDAACRVNHAEIGALMAQGWYLPEEISIAICHHHDYALFDSTAKLNIPAYALGLIATSLLAEHLFQHHSALGLTCEWQKGGDAALQFLGISPAALDEIYLRSEEVVAKI